nr:hypothetical protein [Tanacetum cinerariifolium]
MNTTITVHIITLAVLHLNSTLAVLHLNLTFEVLRLNLTFAVLHLPRSRSEDVKRPRRRGHRRKKSWINVVFHGPLRKRLHCAMGWVCTSEDSVKVNMRKDRGFWIDNGELSAFRQEREDVKNKRYKSSGSSSFYTKDSGEGIINLNTTIGSEDENEVEEVEEVRRPRPMGRDRAKRKMKAGSTSSASSFDVAELAKMMTSEYVMANDPYNIQKKQEMSELLKIKNRELELTVAELKIRRMENRQRDEALYETTTDEALKERLRQRLFG